MLIPFILLLSALFILLSLRQILTVKLVIRDELYLILDFLFINLTLYPFRNTASPFMKNKRKRDKKQSIGKRFNKGKKRLLILNEIISRSDVSISALDVSISDERPDAKVLKSQGVSALISPIIAALQRSSRTFQYNGPDFNSTALKFGLNIDLKTSLLDIVSSLFSYKTKQRKTY